MSAEDLKPYPEYRESGLPWIGQIPANWEIFRAKALLHRVDERSKTGKEELLTVSSARGVVPRRSAKVTMFKAESYLGYKLCWPGDLVINSLWAWGGGLGVSKHHGIISSAYGVYRTRPASGMSPEFLHELVRSTAFNWELVVRSKGVWISRLQLTDESFLNSPIYVPPPAEQAAIVGFLGHLNRRVDQAIRSKRKLVTLLNEQKQCIIQRAVTRGLDPDAPLKDSGIPWLGQIPAHWGVLRGDHMFRSSKKLALPDDIQLSATQAYGVIGQEEYERRIQRRVVKISMHLEKRKHVERDDFVMSMRSFQGGLERAWERGAIRSSYIIFRPGPLVDVDFFTYLLKSAGYIRELQSTGNFIRDGQDLTEKNFRGVFLPVLPIAEQHAIASYIRDITKGLNEKTGVLEREIDLLREYRTRLVSDVVTGKLDVREAAARLPQEAGESDLGVDPEAVGDQEEAVLVAR